MARAGLGWSARELAAKAGVGSATVARFETGTESSSETVAKLERALADGGADFSRRAGRVGVAVPEKPE